MNIDLMNKIVIVIDFIVMIAVTIYKIKNAKVKASQKEIFLYVFLCFSMLIVTILALTSVWKYPAFTFVILLILMTLVFRTIVKKAAKN